MRVVEPLLGTRAEVVATTDSPLIADAVEQAIISEVERLEHVFSIFDPDSALNAMRRSGHTAVEELQIVVALATSWHQRTGGAFHPAAEPLVQLWHEGEAGDTVPSAELLAEAVERLQSPSVHHFNLNALAKGWIAQRAVEQTIATTRPEKRIGDVWLSLGGDIIHRGDGTMTVGIEDPHRPYDNVAPMASVDIGNEALATSGSARRWWTIQGRRYCRVLDPRTGWPVEHTASATVVAPDAATADALATAAVVLQPDETMQLMESEGAICLLVLADGQVLSSSARFIRS